MVCRASVTQYSELVQVVFKEIADKSFKRLLAKCTDNPALLHRKLQLLKSRFNFVYDFSEKMKGSACYT